MYYEWNVLGVQSALLWVVDVMSTNVRVLNRVAGGLNSMVGVVVVCCKCQRLHKLMTASTSRCCGTLLKKPTKSSLMAVRWMSSGVCV